MASEKQIAANRANAKRSTGPRTSLGKIKSSRNSFRHGLSGPLPLHLVASSKVDEIARALTTEDVWASDAAIEFAKAHVELLHIRAIRAQMLLGVDLANASAAQVKRVVALDRYERYAHTKRRQAGSNLEV
jgi:hypothetical protein